MVFSLINPLRLDTKTESESTNRMDIGNLPRWCSRVPYLAESPGDVAYLVRNGKTFVEDK